MANRPQINYYNKDFDSIKEELTNYLKRYYPDVYSDFAEASVGMSLLEIHAYVGDMLNFHIEKTYNELFIDTAQKRESILKIAKNLGYKPRGKRSSITIVELSIDVPLDGSTYDSDYLFAFDSWMKLKTDTSTPVYFEIPEIVDFASEYDVNGNKNRTINPIFDDNNSVTGYKITKSVTAVAGETIVDTYTVQNSDAVQFWTYKIDRDDVLEVVRVINNALDDPANSDWLTDDDNWYEVDALVYDKKFIGTDPADAAVVKRGNWKTVSKRFMTEYDKDNRLKFTFGSGTQNFDMYQSWLDGNIDLTLSKFLDNSAMGVIPNPGQKLHFKYRIGGGIISNVPSKSIVVIEEKTVNTDISTLNSLSVNSVLSSLATTNTIPAIGGAEHETIDEIRHNATAWYSSQDRCVTLDDYKVKALSMPAKFGSIFRVHPANDSISFNKTFLYVLALDYQNKVSIGGTNDLILNNLAEYLSHYRQVGDFIEIKNGNVINIAIDFTVMIDGAYNKKEIIAQCILSIKEHFNIKNWDMNQAIYISKIIDILHDIPGVLSVSNIVFSNLYGSSDNYTYSNDKIDSTFLNGNTIVPQNNIIYGTPTSIFEIRYPNHDIIGRVV